MHARTGSSPVIRTSIGWPETTTVSGHFLRGQMAPQRPQAVRPPCGPFRGGVRVCECTGHADAAPGKATEPGIRGEEFVRFVNSAWRDREF